MFTIYRSEAKKDTNVAEPLVTSIIPPFSFLVCLFVFVFVFLNGLYKHQYLADILAEVPDISIRFRCIEGYVQMVFLDITVLSIFTNLFLKITFAPIILHL